MKDVRIRTRPPRQLSVSDKRLRKSDGPDLIVPDPGSILQLKNRLYDRGLSARPLPSIKRKALDVGNIPTLNTQQLLERQSRTDLYSRPVTHETKRVNSRATLRPTSAKVSITGFVSMGALRPSSARKKFESFEVYGHHPLSSRSNPQLLPTTARATLSRINSARFNTEASQETTRVNNLLNKLTRRPPSSAQNIRFNPQSALKEEDEIISDIEASSISGIFDIDDELENFLQNIQSGKVGEEFIHAQAKEHGNPYDLEIVKNYLNKPTNYYTVSAKGVSTFLNGQPREFAVLSDWLVERESYRQLKSISFFYRFRIWKTCTMWKRNVSRSRREKKTKKLEERLYVLDPVYSQLLIGHRILCYEIEKIRYLEISNTMECIQLDQFLYHQANKIEEARKDLEDYSYRLKDNINQHIRIIMDKLREDIVSDIAAEKNYGRAVQQMFPITRKICSLYEKMGFPENMSYGQRSLLRKECSRFLRFSFLADFHVLQSLRNVYIYSVSDLLNKLNELHKQTGDISQDVSFDVQTKSYGRRNVQSSLFDLELCLIECKIPDDMLVSKELELFSPPPIGNSTPDQFEPNSHIETSTKESEAVCLDVPNLHEVWLDLLPHMEEMKDSILEMVWYGIENILIIERWSRHPELYDFASALEDWDDKVADNWNPPETLMLDPRTWLEDNRYYDHLEESLNKTFNLAYKRSLGHLELFKYSVNVYWKNACIDFELLVDSSLKNQVDVFEAMFRLFRFQIERIESTPQFINSGLLRINCNQIRDQILKSSTSCLQKSENILKVLLRDRTISEKEWVANATRSISGRIATVEEFVKQRTALNTINEAITDHKRNLETLSLLYRLGGELSIGIPIEYSDNFLTLQQQMSTLTSNIIYIESNTEKNVRTFRRELSIIVPDFMNEVNASLIKIREDRLLRLDVNANEILQELEDIKNKSESLENRANQMNLFQRVLEVPGSQFKEVYDLKDEVWLRYTLWKSLIEWETLSQNFMKTSFNAINVKQITEKCEDYWKVVKKSLALLPPNPVALKLKELVSNIKETMPIVNALRAPLLPNHWQQVCEILGFEFKITDVFTLGDLIEMNVTDKQEEIQAVATQAVQEFNLREQLRQVINTWEELELPIKTYKEKDDYILDDLETLLSTLDDSCATINLIAGNRYVAPLREEVIVWKDNLNLMQDILEEWMICQKTWIYLQNIFHAPDIKRQLSAESQMFEAVDKFYRHLMRKTYNKQSIAIQATVGNHSLIDNLKKYNNLLDQIQKNLTKYLESKRRLFPRFYFLSDDELLQIIAQSQNPQTVQPYLKKFFDNVYKLEFGPEENSSDVLAMVSAEGEKVYFFGTIKAKGSVEDWLNRVQNAMYETLMRDMKIGRDEFETKERKLWLLEHPGQVVNTISKVNWCYDTENALKSLEDHPSAMEEWFLSTVQQLSRLTSMVRGSLDSIKRKIIVSLITAEVHNRDTIDILIQAGVENTQDFYWQQQLRYYWDFDSEIVVVRQVQAVFIYGYEYMGATSRLVITPLTDRCWITITSALHIKLGASPAGPAGTGKTESIKDLAKGLGVQCVVFNCSEQITYKMMSRLFSGLAQQGAWSCLDEFNRIDIEVLSVIAQQLLELRKANLANLTEFEFEGNRIPLKSTYGVFVTMNPSYAGRTELPDNLKVLFRPISMMIPDYALIAEIMLYAEGFEDAKVLSKKMIHLYKLASEQLSRQDHYDFGMRAVKSVLVMAGELKRSEFGMSEDIILIRAMRESNLPKFLANDLPLFNALIQDLFPKAIIPNKDYGVLKQAIEDTLLNNGLQPNPNFVFKTFQLFDTLDVRFGVMLVGPTATGKTTCYTTLAQAMTALKSAHTFNPRYQNVQYKVINPKSLQIHELYGDMNPLTQDWKDGLASNIMRQASTEEGDDKKWIVFDGPVDSGWIENMNTVLDDNMMLCLANGQRIKLRNQMRCLFEVQDLSAASPATVSRCGMIYIPVDTVEWDTYVKSWMNTLDSKIFSREIKNNLYELFEATIPACLKYVKTLTEPISSVSLQRVISTCQILSIIFSSTFSTNLGEAQDRILKVISTSYAFSLIWGFGGGLDSNSCEKYSDLVRRLLASKASIPISDTVFDFYLDTNYILKPWTDILPEFNYDRSLSYSEMLVPTINTIRYDYLIKLLYISNRPVFFTGSSGVGKSVIIKSRLSSYKHQDLIEPVFMNFSARTSSKKTQHSIEQKIERKTKGTYAAAGSKKLLIFIDDVNMPYVEKWGCQPPIELLRQLLDTKGFYERDKHFYMKLNNFMMICAAAPPGGGRYELTPRFLRHFHIFTLSDPNRKTLHRIYGSILYGFLDKGFHENVRKGGEACILSCIELYERVLGYLKPTPSKFHYMFNLRDVSKVIQGLLMVHPNTVLNLDSLAKCWIHESTRIFCDRLTNDEDRKWFNQLIIECLNRFFKKSWDYNMIFESDPIIFGDLLNFERGFYQEINDKKRLSMLLEDKLQDFNIDYKDKMKLVFFDEAILNIIKIARCLRQPRGNMLLIGIGGSGKKSLTRLVSYILEYNIYQLQLTKSYDHAAFQEDLKKIMWTTGVEGKHLTFILTDNQITKETFLEDINALLNIGEVSGLYTEEEIEKLIDDIRPEAVDKLKIPDSKDELYSFFVKRVRDLLHIVLCMSPVGGVLRIRCRMFPSIVNCTTMNWFSKWPEQALMSVSKKLFEQIEVPEIYKEPLASMCVYIHNSVETASECFFSELRRKTYVTPKSYLDLIELFKKQLNFKKAEISNKIEQLQSGLDKLRETRLTVNDLQAKLQLMVPDLEIQKKKTEEYYLEVQKETLAAQYIQESVEQETEFINLQALECRAKADEAERDLEDAMPAMQSALKALESLNKNDIFELKKYTKPAAAIQMVMEAVCVLFGEKPEWAQAQHLLGQIDFIQKLQSYPKDEISDSVLRKLKQYLIKPEFKPDIVATKSEAAKSICMWSIAIFMYSEAFKVVKPKKEKVALMQARLDSDMEKLRIKQFELREVQNNVSSLQQQCKDTEEKVTTLQKEIIITQQRLERARKLLDLLAEEGVRWEAELVNLNSVFPYLYGNVFLSVAAISYLGPFTGTYRKNLVNNWSESCTHKKILCDTEFSLEKVIGVPVVIRDWNIAGLPSDQFSIENGILTLNSPRWPLMIDPQNQANRWIKNLEKNNNLIIIKSQTSKINQDTREYIRNLEYGLTSGLPVLLEDADENVDILLDNILSKNTYKTEDGRSVIRLGDTEVQYNPSFRFYITTKLSNPHYLPETSVKVNLINFTVSFAGLEEQLLADIVRLEKPEIEAKKDDVIVSMARDKKLLDETQQNILEMIAVSTGYVLDNVKLIGALERSKQTSKDIKRRIEQSTEVERDINETREKYRSVAIRGSVLYFVVADMSLIDPMYQYSLEYLKKLFNNAIVSSEHQDSIEERIKVLTDDFTKIIYTNICRGLFETHKTMFSFLIATSIDRKSGNITEDAWNTLVRGAYVSNKLPSDDSLRDLLNGDQLELLKLLMDKVPALFNFKSELQREIELWLKYKLSEDILDIKLPGNWEYRLSKFEKLLLIKLLRPEKLIYASSNYIYSSLGKFYTESPSVSLDKVYEDSDSKTPIIFVLSQGADPIASLQKLAKDKGVEDKLIIKSLGQGQGPKAKEAIDKGKVLGHWVAIQNCHLAKSWMPYLEKIVESLRDSTQVASSFRLILTSMPAEYFPVSVLQNGLKVTTEPPRGIKANLKRIYNELNDDIFENSNKVDALKKMLYGLCFFHAIVQERRKYGALGFNIRYQFNYSDLETSQTILKMLNEENEEIPWDALIYMTGNINYGGRVTDDWDRVCLLATLKRCYNIEIFEEDYTISESGKYKIPELSNISLYKQYIETLPSTDEPEIFGLHSNANITYQMQDSNKFLNSILDIQPRIASGGNAKSSDEIVKEVCKNLIVLVPSNFDISNGHPDLFLKAEYNLIPSLSTVLFQEIERFNKLTALLQRTLNDLMQAIEGEILMSEDLDAMYSSLMNSQVPAIWHKISYPSLKPLGSWIRDLNQRVIFMNNWLMNGNPACYWISGFFFPQSFITGVLQTHSRRYSLSIDSLSFSFSVQDRDADEIEVGPYDGVYVYGLYLEGARWDRDERQISEQLPGELYSQLPAIHFLPEAEYLTPIEDYSCPVYKTSARAGELSTTGQSTNFILTIDLTTEESPEHWTLRGAALICQLDD